MLTKNQRMVNLVFSVATLSLVILSPVSFGGEFDQIPGLARVSSTYSNSGVALRYSGYGFVVEFKKRFFVVSAAHLGQGEVSEIEVFDEQIKNLKKIGMQSRYVNTLRDIEVFELQSYGGKALMQFEKNELDMLGFESRAWINLGKSGNENFHLPIPQSQEKAFHSPKLGLSGAETDLTLEGSIFPGMSGLPVVSTRANSSDGDSMVLAGMVLSTSVKFNKSWLARDEHVKDALHAAARNEGSIYPNFKWFSEQNVLYRSGSVELEREKVKFSIQEAIFDRSKTGNGVRADGGGALNASSESEVRSSLKHGLLFTGEDGNPLEISAFLVFYEPLRKFYLLPADMPTINWIVNEITNLRGANVFWHNVTPIAATQNIAELMWKRWFEYVVKDSSSYLRKQKMTWQSASVKNEFSFRNLKSGAMGNCDVFVHYDSKYQYLDVEIDLGFEKLPFRLNVFGGQMNVSDRYRSEIDVRGSKGNVYHVELNGFLLTSPSSYRFGYYQPQIGWKMGYSDQVQFRVRRDGEEYLIN